MQEIELLAPAKDLECGIAAIDCGADAVYIGAPAFGAREAAGNSVEDIAELVKHAHKYWAKIYVTLNTLLRDEEVPQALSLASQLYDVGVDALVIQDTALLECDLPPLPLIASTQMHNNTPDRVAFLEQVGVQRAILARELDLDQIRQIRKRTNLELEFFIHGALCVCYSGQCYLSYALGGRSGNRGQCAQPCRKAYTLTDCQGKVLVSDKHLLSLKDLNLSDHLRELVEAGVSSFKIEGRLKDKAYASNVVAHYRAKLDEVIAELKLKRSSSGVSRIDFTPNVHKTFNRGYTTHFLHGRSEQIGSIDTPKMMGEPIGKVTSVGKRGFTISSDKLRSGDGVCFFDRKGALRGTVINQVQGWTVIPDKLDWIDEGTLLYRNHDHEYLSRLGKARVERQIAVEMTLRESPDGFVIRAIDEDGNNAGFSLPCEKSLAQKPESAVANILKQLQSTGGTIFSCADVTLDLPEVYFLPISALNTLRRGVLEKLESARAQNRPVRAGGALKNDVPYPEKKLLFNANVLNNKADAFYRRHGVTYIEPAAESGLDMRARKLMTLRYCVRHQLGLCPKENKAVKKAEPLRLVNGEGGVLELSFDCAKCEMGLYIIR